MRILLVEDDDLLATGLARLLVSEGYEVEHRADGLAGLDAARTGAFDLIVLDLMLPGMNGYLVCRELRQAEVWTPILMLTAKSGEFDEVEGLETGADDYLVKPASSVVFMARVKALLRRPRRRVDWPEVDGLRLDPLRRICLVEGAPVTLTSRETEVLAYLLDHPGQTIPRAEVLEAVWGADFDGDPNIVEVYISHLRRKLDVPYQRNAIETVRGAGYRIGGSARAATP